MEVGELVRLAASGERAAWESLVERYERLLWGVARSHRLDSASASDAAGFPARLRASGRPLWKSHSRSSAAE